MAITVEQSKSLNEWRIARERAAFAKEEEMRLRKIASELCFPTSKVGTNSLDLGSGYVAKMVKKENFKFVIPQAMLDKPRDPEADPIKLADALDELQAQLTLASNEGPFIFDRLVKISFEPSVTEYKGLSDKMKAIVDPFIETSFGSPALEIKEPAKKAEG